MGKGLKIPLSTWMQSPTISDGFGGANSALSGVLTDGLGHLEQTGLGAGGGGATWHGYAWAVATNKAVATPVLGADIATNGNMEAGDPPTGWGVLGTATLDGVADERTGGAGTQSLSVARNGVNDPGATRNYTVVNARWHTFSVWFKRIDATAYYLNIRNQSDAAMLTPSITGTSTSWVNVLRVVRTTSTGIRVDFVTQTSTDTQSCLYDDLSVKPMPISSLMSSVTVNASPDVFASVDVTVTAGTQAGLLLNSDSSFHAKMNAAYVATTTDIVLREVSKAIQATDTITIVTAGVGTTYAITSVGALSAGVQSIVLTSGLVADIAEGVEIGVDYATANYMLLYHDATNLHLDSVVGGVATALINTPATYAASGTLKLWKLGTAYRAYYRDALVGTQQVVANMNGLYHGLFSTYQLNTLDAYVVYPAQVSIPGTDA